jgi:flagellar hook protein FlgE
MEIQSAFNSGVQGFNGATQQAQSAAENIVDATVVTQSSESSSEELASSQSIPNLNQELVNLKVAEYQAKASAEVIKTADEALGTLLDVTA